MPRQAGTITFVAAFALVPWVLEACSKAANVLEGDLGFGEEYDAGYGGSGGYVGSAGFGAVPGPGGHGSGATQSIGGTMADAGASAGGSPAAGGGPSTGGVPNLDPHARQRSQLALELCALPSTYQCLELTVVGASAGTPPSEVQSLCREQVESQQRNDYTDLCWNQWEEHAFCLVEHTDLCPCQADGSRCSFSPGNHFMGTPFSCLDTLLALESCRGDAGGNVQSPAGGPIYSWKSDISTGCTVRGMATAVDEISVDCGPDPRGPQSCSCIVNGVLLEDAVQALLGNKSTFTADDCYGVARAVAAGKCSDVLECCFTFPMGTASNCACGANPELVGREDCTALAATASGVVVDHCPQYRGAEPR